jgi:CheY-like chemotaxis protein
MTDSARRRVLLVEDDADSAFGLSELLKIRGYDVRVAGSMASALDELGGAAPPEVVVADLHLPDGDGVQLLARLPPDRRVPAIALSGLASPADRASSLEAGFARHLTKPVSVRELIATIEEVLP